MNEIIKRYALFTFVISVLIHISTFFPAWISSLPLKMLFLMHPAVLAAFIATVVVIKMKPLPPLSDEQARKERAKRRERALLTCMPWKYRFLALGMLAYGIVNFILFNIHMEGGGPSELADGTLVLSNHGNIIEEITREEFITYRIFEVRGFSGFWMLFSLMAALLITFGPAAVERATSPQDAALRPDLV